MNGSALVSSAQHVADVLHKSAHMNECCLFPQPMSPAGGDSLAPAGRQRGASNVYVDGIEIAMSRAAYEIRAIGKVPDRLLQDFEGVTVTIDLAGSTIRAELADEAELHGVLDALRREGFLLLDVRRETEFEP